MNSITKETRRESYDAILPKVKKRSRLILETLGDRQMTASEITEELVAAGKIPYFNRNYVAPRLTELKDMGNGQLIRCFYPEKEVRRSAAHKEITVNH